MWPTNSDRCTLDRGHCRPFLHSSALHRFYPSWGLDAVCHSEVRVNVLIWITDWPEESDLADSPFGRPSCCSSLDSDSLSTLCFAALEKMKLSIATLALMSPVSATHIRSCDTKCCYGFSYDGTVIIHTSITSTSLISLSIFPCWVRVVNVSSQKVQTYRTLRLQWALQSCRTAGEQRDGMSYSAAALHCNTAVTGCDASYINAFTQQVLQHLTTEELHLHTGLLIMK